MKNADLILHKFAKIAENWVHNIGPRRIQCCNFEPSEATKASLEKFVAETDQSVAGKGHLGPMLWFFFYFHRKFFRRQQWPLFALTTASFFQKFDNNIGFWEKRQFFAENWPKIAENCDHNIDPYVNQPLNF
jgi:hypothetical protein